MENVNTTKTVNNMSGAAVARRANAMIANIKRTNTKQKKAILKFAVIGWTLAFICGIIAVVLSLRLVAKATNDVPAADSTVSESAVVQDEEDLSTLLTLPELDGYAGRKGLVDYTLITDKTSDQYKLQTMAYTSADAFRMINDRYLVAIGTYFDAPCGTLFDIVLENGEKIPCIVGDIKPDNCTDAWNICSADNCATAFIVDMYGISTTKAAVTGDISSNNTKWQSKVAALYVYTDKII